MNRNKKILRWAIVVLVSAPVLFIAANKLPAGFSSPTNYTHVEIDGVDFGPFDRIEGLDNFANDGIPIGKEKNYATITLARDFVTDPSLYLWAKNRMSRKVGLKDIHLVTENEDGIIISRRVLELCQPLSWSVEATNPSLGGFNETIDLAVQKVSVF